MVRFDVVTHINYGVSGDEFLQAYCTKLILPEGEFVHYSQANAIIELKDEEIAKLKEKILKLGGEV